MPPGHAPGPVEPVGQDLVEDRVDQRGLARAGHAGDGREHAQGEGDGDVLEVVLAGPDHRDLPALDRPAPLRGHLDGAAPGQVVAGEAVGGVEQSRQGAGVDDPPAPLPGARADVDDPVGRADGVLVVLDDNEGVAQVPQALKGLDEAGVVPLVQPDAGLVEHVEDPDQPRADLGGQADALRLPARQGRGAAGQAQVVQADVDEEAQAGVDLGQDAAGDPLDLAGQMQAGQEVAGLAHGQLAQLGDGPVPHAHGQDLGLEARAAAGRAGHLAHVALVALLGPLRLGLVVLAHDVVERPLEAGGVDPLAPPAVAVLDLDLVVLAAQNGLLGAVGQGPPGGVDVEGELLPQGRQLPGEVLLVARPRGDGALGQG